MDKKRIPFEVKEYHAEDFYRLVQMYDLFTPKATFQGMPPSDKEARKSWIGNLVDVGANLLAWRKEEVIGHVVLIPDLKRQDGEYMIFVNQAHRNQGVGSQLTAIALERARSLGLKKIWLTVGVYNFIAIRLYRKFGFEFADDQHESERLMILWL